MLDAAEASPRTPEEASDSLASVRAKVRGILAHHATPRGVLAEVAFYCIQPPSEAKQAELLNRMCANLPRPPVGVLDTSAPTDEMEALIEYTDGGSSASSLWRFVGGRWVAAEAH